MFKVFSGAWRGPGVDPQAELPFIQLAFDFRRNLHHFKGAALSVLLCLALHANQHGEAFPSYELIQAETGLGQDSIGRALEQLCGMVISGQRVLLRYRLRDAQQCFVGGNHYILFPTPQQLAGQNPAPAETSQTGILPNVENAEPGKSMLNYNHIFNEKKNMAASAPQPQNQNLVANAPARAIAAQPAQSIAERLQAFPPDCREAAGLLHEVFGLKPPQKLPGVKGEFALWISGLRSLKRTAADYETELEPALRLAWRQWNRAPFNLAHPAALLKTMTGALAQVSLARHESPSAAGETPLALALKTFVPRGRPERPAS